ncbi:uncharacterized protein K452DRAFT_102460 [Aplosporella prunicola CBS 121167]|uniref:Zn(2)-C6 fungal-type domain-containing protein n=1 Tax=Aplosporella prunicola CBS 121167 TaxID=1176127 RepID=A0A6A6BP54_9PEZI|nr:uncharacterized protein K452DRAFT_102460 [Aplosporella prunicola CBS 121167]KAF2145872.1 hypothetical protein K452DRAFT_102460 [Aplosporella prunicola CBS 121167]
MMPHQDGSVRRGKTFTGCWTCRDRGVKCGLEKPRCLRCKNAKRTCGGYGIRLIWVDEPGAKAAAGTQRRLLSEVARLNPVDESFLDAWLLELESFDGPHSLRLGPFSVFRLENEASASPQTVQGPMQDADAEIELIDRVMTRNTTLTSCGSFANPSHLTIHPALRPYLVTATARERSLFHHWTSRLSKSLMPTASAKNFWQTIFTPMALGCGDASESSPGHASLLHSIYAIAAFHIAEQQPARKDHVFIGIEHYQASVRYLRQSLQNTNEGQEVVLAAIILLATTDIIVEDSSRWRVHIHGGRDWLRWQGPLWTKGRIASTLYQIFHSTEVIGFSHDMKPNNTVKEQLLESQATDLAGFQSEDYCLDTYLGFPKPLFQAFKRMYELRQMRRPIYPFDMVEIECLLEFGKPTETPSNNISSATEDPIKDYAWTAYYASRIAFEREFRHASPPEVHHHVRNCTHHLEAIYAIECTRNVCGSIYCLFIVACEAEDRALRARLLRLFDKGEMYGFHSVKSAREVVKEVWRHRDCTGSYEPRQRQEIMMAMGLDLLMA